MSITDELRDYFGKSKGMFTDHVLAIADRIDAEHEAALLNVHTDLMDASGWVRLPKDADGEYIHIGDKLVDKDDKLVKQAIVKCILYNEEGCAVSDIDPHGCWYDTSLLRHYHAPTVEDVLREFANECLTYATCVDDHEVTDAIELYAAKLRLAGGDE